jgi:hypothetical protein
VVTGRHAFDMTLNRDRLQTVFSQAGHPEISVPQTLNGAPFRVEIPRAVEIQYGHCPTPPSAGQTLANNIGGPPPSATEYSDCLRLREGPNPIVNVPPGVDVEKLAEIGLETAGMNPSQVRDFLQTVNWQSTLVMAVPRKARSGLCTALGEKWKGLFAHGLWRSLSCRGSGGFGEMRRVNRGTS